MWMMFSDEFSRISEESVEMELSILNQFFSESGTVRGSVVWSFTAGWLDVSGRVMPIGAAGRGADSVAGGDPTSITNLSGDAFLAFFFAGNFLSEAFLLLFWVSK